MKRKIILCFALCSAFSFSLLVHAAETPLIKTEIFRSDTADFSYDYKDEIEENGQRYKLDKVDYTVLSKQEETEIKHEVTTKTVDYLYEPSVVSPAQTKSVVIDGKEYTASLEDISYESMIITDRTAEVETTVKLTEDKITDSIQYEYEDIQSKKKVIVTLSKDEVTKTDETEENTITFPVAIKICRILWELAIYRVLAMFFSLADLHNGERMKEIIKAIAGAFIVIAVNAVLLKFYMIFSAWLTTQNIDGFSKSVMLVSVAIAVIDGPNLCQKLIGVDAGIRSAASTVGAMYVAGKAASGAAKAGSKAGKELGEFGKDVANKGAAVGGFAAGAGSRAAGAMKQRSQTPKDERKADKAQAKSDKKQEKAGQKAENRKSADNETINRQVTANVPARMAADSGYTSDSIESYKEAAGTIQAYNGKNDAQLTDMAEDAYLSTHGEQLMNEAAELQDEAAANGSEMSEKDALTTAYAGKHKDSTTVSSDGTYHNAGQQHKNKINALQQSQAQNGNSVTSARLDNYGKIARHAQAFRSSEQFKGVPEVQAHTAAAAKSHGRTYDPAAGSAEKIDAYQGNMSTALAHKDEIMSHAQDYMDEQKQAGHKNVSMEQAVAHVVANEEDYDMSYGFDRQYSSDIADTLVAADSMQPKKSSVTDSDERSSSRRNIRGNSSLNESLSREKQCHNKPRFSPIQSAKRGFDAGRNLGRNKK